MNNERIDNPTFYVKQIAFLADLSVETKLEFLDEPHQCSRAKAIRVEFAGEAAKQVLVKVLSHDERRPHNSTAG